MSTSPLIFHSIWEAAMNGIFKKTFILFLVCALFLTGGVFNTALADDGEGEDECIRHRVTYSYTGTVPDNAPDLPDEHNYHCLHIVTLAAPPTLEGYTFNGWEVSGATVHTGCGDGQSYYYFFMPHGNVQITGHWTADNTPPESPDPEPNPFAVIYAVNYMYADFIPAGAPAVPAVSYFYVGTTANVAPAPQVAGYVFSGWKTTDVTVVNGAFAMPYKNVTFSGSWTLGTAGVPNTGGEPTVLVLAVFVLSGLVLMAVMLRRKKMNEK